MSQRLHNSFRWSHTYAVAVEASDHTALPKVERDVRTHGDNGGKEKREGDESYNLHIIVGGLRSCIIIWARSMMNGELPYLLLRELRLPAFQSSSKFGNWDPLIKTKLCVYICMYIMPIKALHVGHSAKGVGNTRLDDCIMGNYRSARKKKDLSQLHEETRSSNKHPPAPIFSPLRQLPNFHLLELSAQGAGQLDSSLGILRGSHQAWVVGR